MSFICSLCNINCQGRKNYETHLKTTNHVLRSELVELRQRLQESSIKPDQTADLVRVNEIVGQQKKTIEEKQRIIDRLEARLEAAEKYSGKFESIVEKAATRPTTVQNKTTNNVLAVLSSEPLDQKRVQQHLSSVLSTDLVLKGDNAMANAILEPLRDKEGKFKIACTDISRQTFKYRDESGEVKVDPGLNNLMEGLREATKDQYRQDIHMDLYQAAHTDIDKKGNRVLDTTYLQELNDRAKFKSGKVTKKIAKKTYVKARPAKIAFVDDPNERTKELGRSGWVC